MNDKKLVEDVSESASSNSPSRGLSAPDKPHWLKRWVKSIDDHQVEDPIHFVRMLKCEDAARRLADDIGVQNSLNQIYEFFAPAGAVEAETRVTQFLVEASIGFACAAKKSKSIMTPADRARQLPSIAKSARKLAYKLKERSRPIQTGTGHIPYLIARATSPDLRFPSECAGFSDQSPSIAEMLVVFADAIDAQARS